MEQDASNKEAVTTLKQQLKDVSQELNNVKQQYLSGQVSLLKSLDNGRGIYISPDLSCGLKYRAKRVNWCGTMWRVLKLLGFCIEPPGRDGKTVYTTRRDSEEHYQRTQQPVG